MAAITSGREWRSLALAVLCVALGLALITLGVPRSFAAWQALAAEPAVDSLQANKVTSDEELARGVAGLKSALEWIDSDPWLRDLGLLEMNQAQRLSILDPRRAELLVSAESHLTKALSLNPLDVLACVRLASVRELRGAPPRAVAVVLMGALDAAPYDRGVWLWRSSMLTVYLDQLTLEERSAFEGNIRTIWGVDRALVEQLAQFTASVGKLEFVARLFGGDPDAASMIDRVSAQEKRLLK